MGFRLTSDGSEPSGVMLRVRRMRLLDELKSVLLRVVVEMHERLCGDGTTFRRADGCVGAPVNALNPICQRLISDFERGATEVMVITAHLI